jgi:hypothetical protein
MPRLIDTLQKDDRHFKNQLPRQFRNSRNGIWDLKGYPIQNSRPSTPIKQHITLVISKSRYSRREEMQAEQKRRRYCRRTPQTMTLTLSRRR